VSNLERMLKRVRAGEIGFGEFVAGTRAEYRAMTVYLMRKWQTPEWFVASDVEQELYLETWRRIDRFDPERKTKSGKPMTLQRYVVFNAMAAAKREMHIARGVTISGSPDKKPGCFEISFTKLVNDYTADTFNHDHIAGMKLTENLHAARSEENQDLEALAEAEEVRQAATAALKACETMNERYAILAIREAGSLDNASSVLYDDIDHRLDLRLGSEDKAERFVMKHAAAVAERMMAR